MKDHYTLRRRPLQRNEWRDFLQVTDYTGPHVRYPQTNPEWLQFLRQAGYTQQVQAAVPQVPASDAEWLEFITAAELAL